MNKSIVSDITRALRTNRYEEAGDRGIHLPGSRLFIGGFFTAREIAADGSLGVAHITPNRVVNQGLNKILALLGGHATAAPLFLAPFTGNVTVGADWTGATFPAAATELTAYTASTRVPWTTVASTAQQLTNAAAVAAATITLNAGGPYTIRGCALLEGSAKGGTTGPLIAAGRYASDISGLNEGSKLGLEYSLSAIDEGDA